MTAPRGLVLDDDQFRRLAAYGEAEQVETGRNLYASGDDSYDFSLLLTAAVNIVRDATAIEPEHLIHLGGPGDFLGELNLLTGQNVYLTARVVTAGTVVRIGTTMLRRVLAEQNDIADLLLAAFREQRGRPCGGRQRTGHRRPAGRGDAATAHLRDADALATLLARRGIARRALGDGVGRARGQPRRRATAARAPTGEVPPHSVGHGFRPVPADSFTANQVRGSTPPHHRHPRIDAFVTTYVAADTGR